MALASGAPAPEFSAVKSPRLFEEICGRIREAIAAGALKPGDKLPPEREFAVQFGVSRTVLREALRSLEIAGLVRLHKGAKGGAVIQDGGAALAQAFKDMIMLGRITTGDLTEARVLIEDVIVRLACARATDEDIAALTANVEKITVLAKVGRIDERTDANLAFYDILARATHNQTLVLISQSLTRIVYQIVGLIGPGPLEDLAPVRQRFLEHFRQRDATAASRVLGEHFARLEAHLSRHQRSLSNRRALAASALADISAGSTGRPGRSGNG
jgi:GntR family transcriptional regulator, transcriptional repressor for pyruvate dehydrogenase complex